MQREKVGDVMAFNIDTPTLVKIALIVLAIVALVAAFVWLSQRSRQRSRTRWMTDKMK
jgi:cyanate permease